MKRNLFKRGMAGLLSLVMCLTALVGLGTTTAFAAGEQAEVYLISFPRSGDANLDYGGSWGHPNLQYMNGWYSGNSKYTTIRAMHSYEGNICYCIEPGTAQETGDRYTSKDETFWDNLPADFNSTISPYEMKLFTVLMRPALRRMWTTSCRAIRRERCWQTPSSSLCSIRRPPTALSWQSS